MTEIYQNREKRSKARFLAAHRPETLARPPARLMTKRFLVSVFAIAPM
jgi:hypothetical protein